MGAPELSFAPVVLFVATLIALRVALSASRRTAAGSGTFVWLMIAIAEWCFTSGVAALTPTVAGQIAWAKVQYLGIASVGPLWLMFAAEYAGYPWIQRRAAAIALWVVPGVTIAIALFADRLLWARVTALPDGRALFAHGPWFYVIVLYHYAMTCIGSYHLLRAMSRSPGYRAQFVALLVGSIIPMGASLLYVTQVIPLGAFDPTPLGFAVSGALMAWALYRRSLFDVIPVARDQLVEGLGDAVIVLDDARRVVDLNAAARALMRANAPWVGRHVEDVFPFLNGVTDDSGRLEQPLATEIVLDDVHYDVRVTPVRFQRSRRSASVLQLRDVTEQRRATEEREQLVRRKADFVATVSHELRTPLFSIHGALQLLVGGPSHLEPQDRRLVQIALASCERLARIANEILDVSRMEARQALQPRREPVAAERVLADALFDVSQMARAAGVAIDTRIPSGLPLMLGDHDQLVQVLVNLLSNAVKFSAPGATIAIAGAADGTFVSLSVIDRGRGIPAADIDKLFDKYHRAHEGESAPKGTGLGLAIAKDIVEHHGGRITVSSPPSGGATFTVFIPRAPADTRVPDSPATEAVIATKVGPARLLVVDDDDDVREVVVEALERARFSVARASDGRRALDILAAEPIDLLVLDLNMPGMNGYDVLRELRAGTDGNRIPVIVLSGNVDTARSPSDIGADALMTKPTDLRQLVAAVNTLLDGRRKAQTAQQPT